MQIRDGLLRQEHNLPEFPYNDTEASRGPGTTREGSMLAL